MRKDRSEEVIGARGSREEEACTCAVRARWRWREVARTPNAAAEAEGERRADRRFIVLPDQVEGTEIRVSWSDGDGALVIMGIMMHVAL